MAADMYIHVMVGCTIEDLRHFFRNTLGHRFGIQDLVAHMKMPFEERKTEDCNSWSCPACYRVGHSPRSWIGEVSWLKAALFEDEESYIPQPIEVIDNLIDGEDAPPDGCTILTEELRDKILDALKLPNKTQYEIIKDDDRPEDIRGYSGLPDFLNAYIGYPIFTVSW